MSSLSLVSWLHNSSSLDPETKHLSREEKNVPPDQQAESTNHSTNTLGSHGPLSQTTGGTKVGHVKIVGEDGSFALFVAQVSREAALDTSRTPGRHFIVDEWWLGSHLTPCHSWSPPRTPSRPCVQVRLVQTLIIIYVLSCKKNVGYEIFPSFLRCRQ